MELLRHPARRMDHHPVGIGLTMARDYKRDATGKFATNGASKGTSKTAAKPKRVTAKNVARAAGIAVAVGAAAGGLRVRHDALARYDARTAAALLRASDATSSWP